MSAARTSRLAAALVMVFLIAGCAEDVRPPSVQELIDNPITLEAVVVRCSQNRAEMRYEAECVNARQAASVIEAREELARRAALEKQSERKREALRRTQEAAAEARRRAAEARARQREADYLAQFGELPPEHDESGDDMPAGNAPIAIVPDAEIDTAPVPVIGESFSASDGGNAPTIEMDAGRQADGGQ